MRGADHEAFEAISSPVLVLAGASVVFANRAFVAAVGRPLEELLAMPVSALVERTVEAGEVPLIQELSAARQAGLHVTSRFWLRIRSREGQLAGFQVDVGDGPAPGERTLLFREAGADADARRLTDALARASWGLVALRDDQSVLEAAADALHAERFRVVLFRVEGEKLVHAVLRQDEEAQARVAAILGGPLQSQPLTQAQATEFAEVLLSRRARFIQDTHLLVDRFRSPEVAQVIKAAMPRRAVVAPILVEEQPYGVLAAQHDELTPAGVGAIELFAHRVGSAIENVRHHQRAAERLGELQRLQSRLVEQERLATLGEAAAVLSHEVRNPVAAILNAVAVLKRGPADGEVLAMAEEEALRLDRLVRDLLHLARPLQPRVVELDLRLLVERAIASTSARRERPQSHVEVESPPQLHAMGDGFLLGLALENLLANALRASPSGAAVTVSLSREGEGVRIAVEDQGPGIRPEVAERIFEPFFTTSAAGTGLGLAVVRKIVVAHGGVVRARSSPRGGTRFEIVLPGSPAAEAAESKTGPSQG